MNSEMNADGARLIHEASLALLQDPGIRLEHEGIIKLFLDNGARSGSTGDTVRIPPEMVEEYLGACPAEVKLADRRGNTVVLTADSGRAVWSCPGMKLHDGDGVRPFTAEDMAASARLLDGLSNVQGVFGMALDDVPPRGPGRGRAEHHGRQYRQAYPGVLLFAGRR